MKFFTHIYQIDSKKFDADYSYEDIVCTKDMSSFEKFGE